MQTFHIEFQTMDGVKETVSALEADCAATALRQTILALREIMAEHLARGKPIDLKSATIRDEHGKLVSRLLALDVLKETFLCLGSPGIRPALSIV